MIVELKPEQQAILEKAIRSGMSREEVLDQAFAIMQTQHEQDEWMSANRDEIAAHIQVGVDEAERGELIDAEEVIRILAADRAERQIA